MCHLSSFIGALKITWLKNLLDASYRSNWKTLVTNTQPLFNQNMFWSLNQNSFNLLLPKITNLFWKDVVTSWGDYVHRQSARTE